MVSGDCHCGYLSNTHIDKRKFLKVKAQHKNLALAAWKVSREKDDRYVTQAIEGVYLSDSWQV